MDSRFDGICGFGPDSKNPCYARGIMFPYQGRQVSVADYFARVLGVPLTYPNQPILKLGKADVPAEVCFYARWYRRHSESFMDEIDFLFEYSSARLKALKILIASSKGTHNERC